MANYGVIRFVYCKINRKVYMFRYSILLSSKNKSMCVNSIMLSRVWMRPASHMLLRKWPRTLVEFETPGLKGADTYFLIFY